MDDDDGISSVVRMVELQWPELHPVTEFLACTMDDSSIALVVYASPCRVRRFACIYPEHRLLIVINKSYDFLLILISLVSID